MSQTISHPLQSPAWGQFRKKMGVDVGTLGDSFVSFHTIPHTPWTIGYFPKGPTLTKTMIEELQTLGRKKHAIFIQLEPNSIKDSRFRIQDLGLKQSHHPLFTKYTFVIDLSKSEDELLKAMHPKTRYNIRVAQKKGVTIQEDNSPEAFEAYLALSEETTKRQGFFAHNQTYQRTMWNTMHESGIAHLFTATYEGEILTAWIIFVYGDTMYYPYGTSSREHREVMAPTLLLWELVVWGKKQGLKKFDLWGALGPSKDGNIDENDPWFGFHRFKQGFNPELVEFAGSYDLVINPVLYQLYKLADTIRWKLLKFKK